MINDKKSIMLFAMIIGNTPLTAEYNSQVETLPINMRTIQIERSPTDFVFQACST
jgi:hypothetical protein